MKILIVIMAVTAVSLFAESATRGPTEMRPPAPRGAARTAAYDDAKPINPPKSAKAPEEAEPPAEETGTEAVVASAYPAAPRAPSVEEYSHWGIMTVNTNSYASTGRLREKLTAGTLIQIVSRHQTDQGGMMKCRVRRQDAWSEDDDFFIPESALRIGQGTFERTPPEQISVMTAYYGIQAKIFARQDEIRAEVIRSNPHFLAYQKVAQELIAFREQQRDLVQEAESLTGMRRTEANNKLRRMKSEEAELNRKFKQVEERYRAWKETNDDGSRRFPADAALQALERERATLEPKMSLLR